MHKVAAPSITELDFDVVADIATDVVNEDDMVDYVASDDDVASDLTGGDDVASNELDYMAIDAEDDVVFKRHIYQRV